MQQVLIKLLRACWNIVDVPNNKFDEKLFILASLFDHLKAQAPIADTYDALSKHTNMIFQKVFERISEVKETTRLVADAGPSNARGGEGPSTKDCTISWKPTSEFRLEDDSDVNDIQVLSMDP